MVKTLQEWLETDVAKVNGKPVKWLSERNFFRDPMRPIYTDSNYFFAPADGIILYQRIVEPSECIVDIKGKHYTLQNAMQDPDYNQKSIVIGIFMTFYDVHINRISLSGFLSYKEKSQIWTHNYPMLDVEKHLIEQTRINMEHADYIFYNQRVVNKIFSPTIRQFYYILQIADYDVNSILPFSLKQNTLFYQNERFSVVRYGSQVDLILPLSDYYDFEFVQEEKMHIEAGIDRLIKIKNR